MLTIIHDASGAIVGSASRRAPPLPAGMSIVEGNYSTEDQWWDGEASVDREDAPVALSPEIVAVGDTITIDKPADAWVRLPDGSLSDAAEFVATAGYKQLSVTLIGRYRGQASAEIEDTPTDG